MIIFQYFTPGLQEGYAHISKHTLLIRCNLTNTYYFHEITSFTQQTDITLFPCIKYMRVLHFFILFLYVAKQSLKYLDFQKISSYINESNKCIIYKHLIKNDRLIQPYLNTSELRNALHYYEIPLVSTLLKCRDGTTLPPTHNWSPYIFTLVQKVKIG